MLRRHAPRLPAEAAAIVLVALAAALVELRVAVIVVAVFATWAAIAVLEIALARRRGSAAAPGERIAADDGDASAPRTLEREHEVAAPR